MSKKLRSISAIIDAMGGPTELARWADVNVSAVCNWEDRQTIPPAWHLRLIVELRKRGYRIDLRALGIEEEVADEFEAALFQGAAA